MYDLSSVCHLKIRGTEEEIGVGVTRSRGCTERKLDEGSQMVQTEKYQGYNTIHSMMSAAHMTVRHGGKWFREYILRVLITREKHPPAPVSP